VLNANLTGSYKTSRLVIPMMAANGGGANINIAAAQAFDPPALQSAYAAANASLVELTKSMAAELADRHIRVHAICAVRTAVQSPTNHKNQSI
jgi:3-oxoacyl-[acyl-carrier protein] reductase